MKIDLAAKKASGWAFKEAATGSSIDHASGVVTYGQNTETLAAERSAKRPKAGASTARRWRAGSGSASSRSPRLGADPRIRSEAAGRAGDRAAAARGADQAGQVRPRDACRRCGCPIACGARRRSTSSSAPASPIAPATACGSTAARRSTPPARSRGCPTTRSSRPTQRACPSTLRLRAYRSDPDGGLLGPLKATHFGFGDVAGLDSGLGGSGASGRGAVVTNRPLFNPTAFDRTRFEGDLPAGWEAEIYRNGELLAFAKPTAGQRYVFEDVQLLYGENQISIVLYGPQGQIRTREEMINVGQDNVPAGKTWYWAGVNQPGRDVVAFRESSGRV